jgi:SAM-dependent methyltransferase
MSYEFSGLEPATRYRAAIAHEFRSITAGRVLEVGAGIGQMTGVLRQARGVTHYAAVEPDPAFHASFRDRHPTIPLHAGLPEDTDWDTVLATNVLEHIPDDRAALAAWAERLRRRGGRVGLFVPARPELFAPIDQAFGHQRRYTRPHLRAALESAGFRVERLHYFNCLGYFAWMGMFRILRRRRFGPGAVGIFDRWIFPLGNALERRWIRPPFGQSLVAIASMPPPAAPCPG